MMVGVTGSPVVAAAPAGITLVGVKSFGTGSSSAQSFDFTGLSGGSDTSPSVGDYFLIILGNTGWTAAPTLSADPVGTLGSLLDLYSNDSIDSGLRVVHGVYEAGSSTGGTMAAESGINSKGGVIVVLRGVDATTPMDVTPVTATGINTDNPDPPSITPVTAGALIIAVGTAGHNDHPATSSIGNMTLVADLSVNSGTYDMNLPVAIKDDWASGAFDPDVMVCTAPLSSAHSWAAATLAIRPA